MSIVGVSGGKRERFGQWERWSIVRILDVVADRVGRGTGRGWPWLWRLKTHAADTFSATPD
jgi:hypothetical protein